MGKQLLLILFVLFCNVVYGQISVSPKDTTICKNDTITLNATLSSSFPGNIANDDIFGDTVAIGFDFEFYGKTYNKCIISANNYISFNLSRANLASHYIYNTAVATGQLDTVIMFPFQDINPNIIPNGGIQFVTVGTPGNRKFVVQFCNMALYNCNNLKVTNQLVLYETTNIIEIHTTAKPSGCGWQNGTGVMGLRSGNFSSFVPGRDVPNLSWAAYNEGVRFTPSGTNNYTVSTITYNPVPIIITQNNPLQWFRQNGTVPIDSGNTINVVPDGVVNYYVVKYSGTGVCNSNANFTLTDTVFINYNFIADTINATICQGDSFNFYGKKIGIAGWYDTVINTSLACDSMIYLHLTVNPIPLTPIYDTICQGELPIVFGGQNIYGAGTYYDTLTSVLNCDSIVALHLTVLAVQSDTFTVNICKGLSYTYNAVTYNVPGYYSHFFKDMRNCDSIMVLHLVIDSFVSNHIYDTVCYEDFYVLPQNDTVFASGVYYDTFTFSNTCDSIVITHLYKRDTVGVTVYDTLCADQLPIVWNGITVNAGGASAAVYTGTNVLGCDSNVTLHLTVHNTYLIPIYDSVCDNELPYVFGGNNYNNSGTYTFNHQSVYGCDSVVQLHLTVLPHHRDTFSATICYGQSYSYNGNNYSNAGFYTNTFVRANGCDSIRVLDLKVDTVYLQHVYDTICFEDMYILPGNDTVNQSGVYYDTLFSVFTCDSIIITHLYVRSQSLATVSYAICSNQIPFVWNGFNVNASGNGVASYTTSNIYGCDSTTTLNLTINNVDSIDIYDTVCTYALPYIFLGTPIYAAGQYRDTLINIYGCDSIVKLILTVNPYHADTTLASICANDSYYFDGNYYDTAGIYTHSYINQYGCDSVRVLDLFVYPVTPLPVVVSPIVYCRYDNANVLTALGANLRWYTTATGGVGSNNAPTPITNNVDTQRYYVSQTLNDCESQRVEITVVVREKVVPDFELQRKEVCQYNALKITYTGQATSSSNLVWNWDGGILDSVVGNDYYVHWNVTGTKQIALFVNNLGCNGDTVIRFIEVKSTPIINTISLKDYACVGDTIVVAASSNNNAATYLWTVNGAIISETENSFERVWQNEGWYRIGVKAQIDYCSLDEKYDSIYISNYPIAKIISHEQVPICLDEPITLTAKDYHESFNYTWNPIKYIEGSNDEQSIIARLRQTDTMYLKVINTYGCTSYDKLYLEGIYCCYIGVPNAFSPNGDGLNDRFEVVSQVTQGEFLMQIFDRWGKQVFEGNSINSSWDGTYNGKQAGVGTYFYKIVFTCISGEKMIQKGDLTLIR